MLFYADERRTRQLWRRWYRVHWRVLRCLRVLDDLIYFRANRWD